MNYQFIGWNCEDNHDKVWGVIDIGEGRAVVFWGRRGKKLQTKIDHLGYELDRLIENKQYKKGYIRVAKARLDQVYPEFEQDLEKTAVWAMLTN